MIETNQGASIVLYTSANGTTWTLKQTVNSGVNNTIGPSLARFGVTNCLANPNLRIFDVNGVLIGQNDNWMASQASEIAQTPFAPLDPLDSAIILSLVPGNYTAIVSGVGGGTGNGLVEVYLLP